MFLLWIAAALTESVASSIVRHEVNAGDTVKLSCPSNDANHRFQYWQLVNDDKIGEWNDQSRHKINFEVVTGDLIIKDVLPVDSGVYKCISKAITGPSLRVEEVELVVKHDLKDISEDEVEVNIYKGLIIVLCILILILFGILVCIIEKRRARGRYEVGREDSPDKMSPPHQGTYNPTVVPYIGKNKSGRTNEALTLDPTEEDVKTFFVA